MHNQHPWIPPLIKHTEYKDIEDFIEAIYKHFKEDFVDNKPTFRDKRLGLKRLPLKDGKEATFWHFISKGDKKREINLPRCKRIKWPKPIIENEHKPEIKVFSNRRRRNEKRILLWFESINYVVILAQRNDYLLPWTAYIVDTQHE
ncbi:MAG: hypothetical protein ABIH39_09150, partial [Candidatus Margulisiibacteriota bacterium]